MSSGTLRDWCDPEVILAATNLHDEPALMRHAAAEAKRSGTRLLLVHVLRSAGVRPKDIPGSSPHILLLPSADSAWDALDHLALKLQRQGVLCEPVLLKGRPEEQIPALVQSRRVDRVIVAAPSCRRMGAASPPAFLADN